ncbi:hypothetical protein [Alicyclobacillus ferrooxydans]|uniref:Uncharacterized protein n=1 Tax=Alicyclobacillus ferrooxydans TaxID=471514 RepID=A0A0P9D6Z2_9BACL|nr:hypothetical protein [Alicyclobacillus ferrooxydans]KPV45122.1 hypothetical protein AN477_03815 [Alicyclobacillus ferrooxydans]
MDNVVWTADDSVNLQRIAIALERLVSAYVDGQPSTASIVEDLQIRAKTLEAELFTRVLQVYFEEEQLVLERGGGKKSSIRVSNNLARVFTEFFSDQVPDVEINVEKGNMLVFWRDERPLCALKVYTDLGYGSRGERWYGSIDEFVREAQGYGIKPRNVFFLVMSMRNGLDNEHVQQLLGREMSNKELLDPKNRSYLEEFLREYVSKARGHVPDPRSQLYFLAAALHPNVLEEALAEDIEGYDWLQPSVSQLVHQIQNL